MTIEKAIEALSLLKIFDAPSLNEAVKMAVAALQSQADTPPNDPLTLEELREMDGEPVWIVQINGELRPFWGLVDVEDESAANRLYAALFEDYGAEWLAYRRKPEEGTT